MRKVIVGIDGGGTKTRLAMGTLEGRPLGDVTAGGSNYQHVGRQGSAAALREGLAGLLRRTGAGPEELAGIYLTLSGADLPEDFAVYETICREVFAGLRCPETPFTVVNDVWAVMRAGLRENCGAVLICGTGSNAAVRRGDGARFQLRQLEYELGAFGGSMDIARDAFHLAFRSAERTGEATRLETALPKRLGLAGLEDCIPLFYPARTVTVAQTGEVTKLVFQLAEEGDAVCVRILREHGEKLAWNLRGVLAQAGMERDGVPVVLGGTLLSFEDTPLFEGLTRELGRLCPGAQFVRSGFPPVYGAFLNALEAAGGRQTEEIDAAWSAFWR